MRDMKPIEAKEVLLDMRKGIEPFKNNSSMRPCLAAIDTAVNLIDDYTAEETGEIREEPKRFTLEDAIENCKEKAREIRQAQEELPPEAKLSKGLLECACEQEQLAEWLEELKAYRSIGERLNVR